MGGQSYRLYYARTKKKITSFLGGQIEKAEQRTEALKRRVLESMGKHYFFFVLKLSKKRTKALEQGNICFLIYAF